MMLAKCTKPCPFAYGSCKTGVINLHPRLTQRDDLLRDENGMFYCYYGRLLTVYDKVCETCGEELEPCMEGSSEKVAVWVCPNCKRKISTDVIW